MKQSNKKANIMSIFIICILVIFALVHIWRPFHKTSLIDLQNEILVANTASDTLKVVIRLDKYYLTMFIPDTIRQRVQAEADTLIKRQEQSNPLAIIDTKLDTNIFQTEVKIKELLRTAMIARVRKADSTFQSIIQYATTTADTIDSRSDNNFWRPWVIKIKSFDCDKATKWLLADRAERLSWYYIDTAPKDAEKYGALGLQLLEQVGDPRLQLDIIQRLVVILYRFRDMYDLCVPFAENAIKKSTELKYQIRTCGMLFFYASTLWSAKRNQPALSAFEETIQKTERYRDVKDFAWYRINAYIGTAKVNWQLGNYQKALSICDEVEKFHLDYSQKIDIHMTKGIAHRNLGIYDKAAEEYLKALDVAKCNDDTANQIIALANLGIMYHRLTEYDKACFYYDQSMALHLKYDPQNIVTQIRLLINIAETNAAQNQIEIFNRQIQQANNLTKSISLPGEKAELLRSLGRLNKKMGKFQQAYDQFQQAIALFDNSGLLRLALETKNDLARCFIHLSRYQEAKILLDEIYLIAKNIQDAQNKIDAIGMMAEIAWKEGDLDKAVQKSNHLINEIESLSLQLKDIDNLIIFRQKIHDHLKQAVLYEIEKRRVDSAFVKLDYIKARSAMNALEQRNNNKFQGGLNPEFINIEEVREKLNKKMLLISYMVTADTLFIFVLDKEHLKLFKKPINIEKIRNLTSTFLNSINKTIDIFQSYESSAFATHYDSVTAASRRLYQTLLYWQEFQLNTDDYEIMYIIPDDVIYGIPFACLMNNNGKFLIQQTAVVNLPGVFFLKSGQHNTINHDIYHKRVLVSADYDFPGAHELVKLIKKQFPQSEELAIDKPVIKKEDILSKLNEQYEIYFFIGHSEANPTMPDLSYFELTASKKSDLMPTKIAVSLADFKKVNWSQADMVFLIGCETATGKLYEGSGFLGFQQSLLSRGAKTVLATIWKIDAKETISQFRQFLVLWGHHLNPSIALQEVNKNSIERLRHDPYFGKPHPYFWGNFILSQLTNYN